MKEKEVAKGAQVAENAIRDRVSDEEEIAILMRRKGVIHIILT